MHTKSIHNTEKISKRCLHQNTIIRANYQKFHHQCSITTQNINTIHTTFHSNHEEEDACHDQIIYKQGDPKTSYRRGIRQCRHVHSDGIDGLMVDDLSDPLSALYLPADPDPSLFDLHSTPCLVYESPPGVGFVGGRITRTRANEYLSASLATASTSSRFKSSTDKVANEIHNK